MRWWANRLKPKPIGMIVIGQGGSASLSNGDDVTAVTGGSRPMSRCPPTVAS
jgi:hypothetical protein